MIKATDTETSPAAAERPSTKEDSNGKYGAKARSSKTKIATTRLESSDLRQPVSRSNCEAIPEEDTYAMPPTTNAASGPQPKASASRAPGIKFVAMSKNPADFLSLKALANSGAEYSSPNRRSNKIAPI